MSQSGFFSYLYRTFFTFSGRLNRKPYIMRSLVAIFLPVILAFVLFYLFAGGLKPGQEYLHKDLLWPGQEYLHKDLLWLHVTVHSLLIILAIFMGFSLGVRRCHDLDKSGWWLLLGAVPYINIAWGLYLACKRGTVGPNRYGDDPICDDYERMEDIAESLREKHGTLKK